MRRDADILKLIGNTPLVRLKRVEEKFGLKAKIFAKLEFYNPLRSVKDRIGWAMVRRAIDSNQVTSKTVFIEPTSGNTGIALAFVCATLDIPLILTMPESMSQERRSVLKALGAQLILTPAAKGMIGAIGRVKELMREDSNLLFLDQFSNPANPETHYGTTGPEIWEQTKGEIDAFVLGVGTGGTLTGAGRFLKERKKIQVFAVEPKESSVLSGGQPGPHKIQGIGAGFVPKVLDMRLIDEIVAVNYEQAKEAALLLAKVEGMLCGISSGAALAATVILARRDEFNGNNFVTVLPDLGERYLSTGLFESSS